MKDLRVRLGFGALLVAAVAGLFWLDRAVSAAASVSILILLALAAQAECCRMLSAAGLRPNVLHALAAGTCTLIGAALGWSPVVSFALPLALLFALEVMRRAPAGAALRLGGAVLSWALVPLTIAQAVELRVAAPQGWAWLVFLVAVCKAGDSAAYLVGSAIGRHKLIPQVSPNKSWEGAFASLAGGVLAGWLVASAAFPAGAAPGVELWLPAALLTNLGAQFGDLVESVVKRSGALKDSSALLPAFGGAFDLLDSFLLASPALALFLRFSGYTPLG
jgi:phosphatidate cytidylyltransferase